MNLFVVIIGLLLIIAGGCLGLAALLGRRSSALREKVMREHRPDEFFIDVGGAFIGYRLEDQMVIYGGPDGTEAVPMSAITSVDVRKNGVSVTKVSRGSQLAGAAVGGLLFGLPGALVGGLSGSSTTAERVKAVSLAFTFEHGSRPFHQVVFGAWAGNGVPENGILASETIGTMDRFRARAVNALQSVDRHEPARSK